MSDTPVTDFLSTTTRNRLRLARDTANRAALQALLGESAYAAYRQLADGFDESHLSFDRPPNLIFVPGVMGSLLHSRSRGGIWWIDVRTRAMLDHLRLSTDGLTDAEPANDICPVTTDFSYDPFLAAALGERDFSHEIFAYDWRKSLRHSAGALRDLVVRLHRENGGEPVHLVAHSMGGLLVRIALLQHAAELWPRLGRIVFLATPHYGATAIAGYLKNHFWGTDMMALLGLYISRETLRSLWGVLSLLPAPKGVYPGTRREDPAPFVSPDPADPYRHPCANFDLYSAEQWKLDLTLPQTANLQRILDDTAQVHTELYQAHQAMAQDQRDRMLMIAGVGYRTLFRLAYQPRFFGFWEKATKETSRIAGDLHREGDSRVPLASASLENVRIRYVKGMHGELPNIPAVYRDVFRWLREDSLNLPDSVGDALSGHLASDEPPVLGHRPGAGRASDDAGLWDLDPPSPERLAALQSALERDSLPEFIRVRPL